MCKKRHINLHLKRLLLVRCAAIIRKNTAEYGHVGMVKLAAFNAVLPMISLKQGEMFAPHV